MPPQKPQQAAIPFVPDQSSGLDVLRGASPVAMNVIIDGRGTVRRRPGITAAGIGSVAGVGVPISGMHSTSTGRTYAFAGVLPGGQDVYELLLGADLLHGAFTGSTRPVVAETEAMLAVASSRGVTKVVYDTNLVAPLGGSPPDGSHIISQASRLLANDVVSDKTRIHYSAQALGDSIAGHETWGAGLSSGSFVAEGRADPLVALAENSNEVFAFGTTSLQTFITDANLVYVPVATLEYGCATPQGIVKADQMFAWMDDKRRFIQSDGRTAEPFSQAIQQTLEDLVRVDDCFGYRVVTGPIDAFVWTFPTDGRTFAFQRGGGWATWMGYSDTLNNWTPMLVTAHTLMQGANDNLVGLSDGRFGVMRNGINTDLGQRLPAYIETGFIDRGTDNRKACRSVKVALRRGTTTDGDEPLGRLQYRDSEGEWRDPLTVSFGQSGDRTIVADIRSLGVYRRRQWRFSFHGTSDFTLAGVQEEYQVLDN